MKKVSLAILACLISIASGASYSADDRKGTLDFNTDARPAEETALVRAARDDELRYKPSTFTKFLMPVAGTTTAQMDFLWPADDIYSGQSAAEFESVRILPGAYLVKVRCALSGYTLNQDVPIRAQAGKTYLLECVGRAAHGAHVSLREIEGS